MTGKIAVRVAPVPGGRRRDPRGLGQANRAGKDAGVTRSALGRQDRHAGSALGLTRVVEPPGVLPQAAWRLDPDPRIGPDEVRVAVDRLNLDAASYRQLRESTGGSAEAMRGAVLGIVAD